MSDTVRSVLIRAIIEKKKALHKTSIEKEIITLKGELAELSHLLDMLDKYQLSNYEV